MLKEQMEKTLAVELGQAVGLNAFKDKDHTCTTSPVPLSSKNRVRPDGSV